MEVGGGRGVGGESGISYMSKNLLVSFILYCLWHADGSKIQFLISC